MSKIDRFTVFVLSVFGVGLMVGLLATAAITKGYAIKEDELPPEIIKEIEYVDVIQERVVEVLVPTQTIIDAVPMGEFEVTYYTAGVESTGKKPGDKGYGVTKSGAIVRDKLTVAVDPKVIPLGTYLYIEGIGFRVAQDIGGAIKGNKVDIYVPTVNEARSGGRHKAKVYILKEGKSE